MSDGGWQGHLNEAATQRDVVSVCNQFLTMWTEADLAELPESCRPKPVIALEDVRPYAVKLVLELGNRDDTTARVMHRMSTFFTKAALRLAEIGAAMRGEASHDDPLHTAFLTRKVTGQGE
jgi:hypothetical protein